MPDSSCMVAALSDWHEHHRRAVAEVERRLERGEPMLLAAPALVETYSVLTRLPRHRRAPPQRTLAALEASFIDAGEVIVLDGSSYRDLLRRAPIDGVAGGRIYDAVIAACAERAGVSTLLTFNVAHFRPLLSRAIEVVAPAAA